MKKFLLITSAIALATSELAITAIPSYSASTNKAQSACLTAVAEVVGTSSKKLSVMQAKETAKGVEIKVKVPGAQKPWLCTSSKNGTVKKDSVMYGGEG